MYDIDVKSVTLSFLVVLSELWAVDTRAMLGRGFMLPYIYLYMSTIEVG
jgi:hypothetical protein